MCFALASKLAPRANEANPHLNSRNTNFQIAQIINDAEKILAVGVYKSACVPFKLQVR